jgi:thymidylate kinase
MIIEFFGPPCSGKTTLAHALSERLRESGYDVRLISSYRPDERGTAQTAQRRGVAAMQRMIRAVRETVALIQPRSGVNGNVTGTLLRLMPPRRMTQSLRIGQYLTRLLHNWREAENRQRITVFDQAFTQALSSLALLNPGVGRAELETGLSVVPKPDLLIALQVPKEVLAARLTERERRQGRLERMLEVSPAANLASLPLFGVLEDLTADWTSRVIQVSGDGGRAVAGLVLRVEEAISTGLGSGRETVSHCPEVTWQR